MGSEVFYLVSIVGGIVLQVALRLAASPNNSLGALAALAGLYASIVLLVMLWKAWKSLQDYTTKITPGLAVGLLFIPIFNMYWIFRAFWGFAKEYNSCVEEYDLKVPRVTERIYLGYCILTDLVFVSMILKFVFSMAFIAPPAAFRVGPGFLAIAQIVFLAPMVISMAGATARLAKAPKPEPRGLVY